MSNEPLFEPARTLYRAVMEESKHRKERRHEDWVVAERQRMWHEAKKWAEAHGCRVPTIEEVQKSEEYAMGHCDYLTKWVYGVVEKMRKESV